nr:hypothetical protein [uncultured Carboxylicivirga sp.]
MSLIKTLSKNMSFFSKIEGCNFLKHKILINNDIVCKSDLLFSENYDRIFKGIYDYAFDLGNFSNSIYKSLNGDKHNIYKISKKLDSQFIEYKASFDTLSNKDLFATSVGEVEVKKFNLSSISLEFLCDVIQCKVDSFPTREELIGILCFDEDCDNIFQVVKDKIITRLQVNYLKALLTSIKIDFDKFVSFLIPLDLIQHEYIDLKCTIKDGINNLKSFVKERLHKLLISNINGKEIYRFALVD